MELNVKKSEIFSSAELGDLSAFMQGRPGKANKVFLRDQLELSGMEVSLTSYPAAYAMPFFHSHIQNEELYIVIRGEGQMQLDEKIIDLKEGSVVKVLPNAERIVKSAPNSELLFLCIQAKRDSLEQCNSEDGVRNKRELLLTK